MDRTTNNGRQYSTQKTNDWATQTLLTPGINSGAQEA